MPNIQITDSFKTLTIESDIRIYLNAKEFVGLIATLDAIQNIMHATEVSFVKNMDGGTTYDYAMATAEDKKIEQHVTFQKEGGVVYAVNTGNSWSSDEWDLLDLAASQCADLVALFGVTTMKCVWG